jgi:uncharacterized damage-inducible protein DinB
MTSATDGRRRFEYHAWATRRLVEALVDEGAGCAVMAHACTADRVWTLRLRGESTQGIDLWPGLTPAGVRALAAANEAAWAELLHDLDDIGLRRVVSYITSRGEPFDTSASDILEHVLLHGAYHRGQAAAALRAAGAAPPVTDYVAWVRTS